MIKIVKFKNKSLSGIDMPDIHKKPWTRKQFLQWTAAAGALIALGTCSYLYLNDEKMRRAPPKEGMIIADLHAHPGNKYDVKETLEMLCSSGIIGLTNQVTKTDPENKKILTYKQAVDRFSNYITEINKGSFARIKTAIGTGYFIKTQEIESGIHHLLAIGWEGENYFSEDKDARKTVEEIHLRKGLAILCHPYITLNKGARIVKYRLLTSKEEEKMKELCGMVDEIEVFNAQCINPAFGIIIPNMKKANYQAEQLLNHYKQFKGIASSDAHFILEQPKICGIYLDEKELCLEKLKEDIKKGNFERLGNSEKGSYVSRWSFLKGMFFR